jgi:hypothetical protein
MKLRNALFIFAAAILATLSLVVVSSPSGAAARVAAPASVTASASGTSATLTWAAPGGTVTGYRVSRDGVDAHGGGAYTTIIAATRHSFTFTLLVPGRTYHLSVATRNGSAQSLAVTKTVAIAAPPRVSGVTLSATDAQNPLFAHALINASTGDAICAAYHWSDDVCGSVTVSATVTGYTGPTTNDYFWIASADLSRTFGCYNTVTHAFTSKVTISSHKYFNQYASYFANPATGTHAGGTYFFSNAGSWDVANDMPAPFACPWGWDHVDHSTTISNVKVGVYNTGGIGSADGTAPQGAPVVVVSVPGSASAPFADPS